MVLILYVLHDHLIGYVAATAAKISPRPQMPAPVLLAQVCKLIQQPMRRLTLQPLHEPTYRHLRRNRHKHMYMVLRDMPLDDLNILAPTNLSDQIPDPMGHVLPQDRLAVFGDPHDMHVDHEYGVRPVPIFRHTGFCTMSMLKLPPEGGGFNPPKVGAIKLNLKPSIIS